MRPEESQLGKKSAYISEYDPSLLFPIPRKIKRDEIGINEVNLPFYGMDIWNHYEVSWLDLKGKPQVAIAIIEIPVNSINIIESKSMKLYFNSFNNYKMTSRDEVQKNLEKDLSKAANAPVKVNMVSLEDNGLAITQPIGVCLDNLDIELKEYLVNPKLIKTEDTRVVKETVYSNLLKSNCLVTNQPDWATVTIDYEGAKIEHESLLKYIISFRNHNEFHEQCVERIFSDIMGRCNPIVLTVSARFTRRGGLDINPIRSTSSQIKATNSRLIRQ